MSTVEQLQQHIAQLETRLTELEVRRKRCTDLGLQFLLDANISRVFLQLCNSRAFLKRLQSRPPYELSTHPQIQRPHR